MSMTRIHVLPRLRRPRAAWRPALILLALLAGIAVLATPAAAANETLDLPFLYRTNLRALAMGNAFEPIARGEAALTYNPAGLVQYNLDIKIEGSLMAEGEAGTFLKDSIKAFGSPSATDLQNYLTKYLGTSQNYRVETFYNGVANLAAFHMGLGAGVMKQQRYSLTFTDNTPTGFDINDQLTLGQQDLSLKVASFGFQLFDGQMLVGATLKNFTYERKTATDTFANVITGGSVKLTTTGPSYTGSGYDLGMIWRMESLSFLRGQWSLVANNIGGITLQSSGNPTLDVPASYDVGLSINPELPWSPVHVLVSVQEDDITGAIKVRDSSSVDHARSTKQRLHMGAELGFWETATGNNILNVRVGNNRGGTTSGFELNLFSGFRLLYTRYKDDFGYSGTPDPHTFQAVQLTLGLAF
ncbi:MAG TPA: hypothetical protein VKB51_05775 [bacterium]|nr:hypothetical protein [bacterium]